MNRRKTARWMGTGTILMGGLAWLAIQAAAGGSGSCSGLNPQFTNGSSSVIVHAPTISAPTVEWELHVRKSPLSAADAAFIEQQSQQDTIDAAFALAVWAEETQDGAAAFAGTHNIGNVTGTPGITVTGADGVTRTFQVYASWQDAIAAWFSLVETLYVRGGHAQGLGTFALYYVHGLLPDAPGAAQVLAQMEAAPSPSIHTPGGYVWQVEQIIGALHAHEQQINSGTSGSGTGAGGAQQALAALLPTNVSHAWASASALKAAATLSVESCQAGRGSQPTALQSMTAWLARVFQIAGHLQSDGAFFDAWDTSAPAGVRSQGGTVWCTDFIASLYQVVTRKAFPAFPDADQWMATVGQAPGFHAFLPAPGISPQPGEVAVLETGFPGGHVALVVGVQPPQGNQPGFVLVAQGHSTSVLEKWALFADGTVRPPWAGSAFQTLGYLQVPAFQPAAVTTRMLPLTQADNNGQYDSVSQYHLWWNAVCSAATFTEVARAWGLSNVTIGQALDRLLAHTPPYITVAGGLVDQAGWTWMAAAHHLQAQVAWHAYTFDSLVQQVTTTGIPIIIGLQGGDPADPWGHFVVVVGGDSTQVQIVDSSLWRMHTLPRRFFSGPTQGIINVPIWWTGETVVITPA